MPHSIRVTETATATAKTPSFSAPAAAASLPPVQPLTDAHRAEVLAFLAASRSVDTIFMSGLIRDNGVVSSFNRGAFYGCRDARGELEGVALVGHATLVEVRSTEALTAFARFARERTADAHVIVGEQEKVEQFWTQYEQGGQEPLRICRELFLEQRWPIETLTEAAALRLATSDDLEALVAINARMACDESGVNPLETDAEGFRARLMRRIELGRVWVWTAEEDGRLLFKVDIMAEVPGCIYLEGVYVHADERGRGYGRRAISQLGRLLLARTESLCLLVNEQNKDAQIFFFKAGYKLRACYDTIFLQPKADAVSN